MGRSVIHVRGDLDVGSLAGYLRVVRQCLGDGDRRIEGDLAGVTFVDVAGLRALLHAEREARRSGRELRYRQPSGAVVRLARLLVLPHVRSSIGLDVAGDGGLRAAAAVRHCGQLASAAGGGVRRSAVRRRALPAAFRWRR